MCRSIVCADGLKGFPEAIKAAFKQTTTQLHHAHVWQSPDYVAWKQRPKVAANLKCIYTCATSEEAELRLTEFEARRDDGYQPIGPSWRRNGPRLVPSFGYPPETRKVIYTSNAIESGELTAYAGRPSTAAHSPATRH